MKHVTEPKRQVTPEAADLAAYFRRHRATQIRKYKAATLWVQRWTARDHALHFGRLVRKLEGRA